MRCHVEVFDFNANDGVADGARTHDNRNHNPGLYQLSYSHHRICILFRCFLNRKRLYKHLSELANQNARNAKYFQITTSRTGASMPSKLANASDNAVALALV